MRTSPSAGLLAFLLALPALALVVPPPTEASGSLDAGSMGGAVNASEPPPAPGEAMEARLQRLAEAIRERASHLPEDLRGAVEGDPWLLAGGWLNGNNRGWVNRGWNNRAFGGSSYRPPQVWANFRPSWRNFHNSPGFLNW